VKNGGTNTGSDSHVFQVQVSRSGVSQSGLSGDPESVLDGVSGPVDGEEGDSSSFSHDKTRIGKPGADSVIEEKQKALLALHELFDSIRDNRQQLVSMLRSQSPGKQQPLFGSLDVEEKTSSSQTGVSDRDQVDKRGMIFSALESHMREFESGIDQIYPHAMEALAQLGGFSDRRALLSAVMRKIARESDQRISVNMVIAMAGREVQRVVAETWLALVDEIRARYRGVLAVDSAVIRDS